MKTNTPPERLCEGLPHEFADFLTYARGMKFAEKPDYSGMRLSFRRLLASVEPDRTRWVIDSEM